MFLRRSIFLCLLTAMNAAAETCIRIEGSQAKSESQLLGLMGGRLAHVREKPAASWRADDTAFLLSQVMQKDGYSSVEVDWKIVNRHEIVLVVRQGQRLSLGEVTIRGAPPEDTQKLAKLYRSPAEKGRPIGSGTAPFREEDVEIGRSYIVQQLNAEGYWAAEVTVTSRETDPASGEVSVVIDVDPGSIYRIGPPKVISPDRRGIQRTTLTVQPFIGRNARTANLNAMRLAVEEAFTGRGYPDAKIEMVRRLDGDRFISEFYIDLGTRVRLQKIHIEGLERTNPARISRRMKRLEGEWYDEAAMNKNLRGFLATGAFSSARVETEEVSNKKIDATLHFQEGRAREVSVAVGAGSYQGFISRITYADRNLFGELLGFSTGFEFSSRGVLGETRIADPWLFGSDVSGSARVYALIYGREGYSTFETGLDGMVGWKFGDHYSLELLAGYSVVNLSSEGLSSSDLGETVYRHPKLRVTQILDFRDSPVLPTSGWHLENPLEIGAALGDLSTGYVQAGLTGGWYHKIGQNYQLGIGGEWGMVVPSGDGSDMPIDLRLFNGGSRSVRSFPERELGPTGTGNYPVGGEAMWNTKVEIIRSFGGSLGAVAFMDAGSLATNFDGIASAEVEVAAGLGMRLELPIGPVRLEYGYNLTRDPGEPSGTLHFAIGFAY
ncbi:MAG: BamA/TamA family outer membrane protein [Akkermansiaceae bacterium]